MKAMKTLFTLIFVIFVMLINSASAVERKDVSPYGARGDKFTQEDRERLISLEVTMKEFKESVEKRFEIVDKRIVELREDMNKRFEQIDKRLEQVDKRFEQMLTFLWILSAIFVTLTLGNIGFAYWDRRTIIKKATDDAVVRIEKEGKVTDLINAFRELARKDQNIADILRKFNLL
jgi:predicted transcriptional regulator